MALPPATISSSSEPTSTQPSQFHLAIALAIAKSKPSGISIRDYILELSNHITQKNRLRKYGSIQQYLDAVGVWKSRYQQEKSTSDEVRTRVAQADVKIDELTSRNAEWETRYNRLQAEFNRGGVPATPKGPGKRTMDRASATPSPSRPQKQVRADQAATGFKEDATVLEHTEAGLAAAQHLYRIYKALKPVASETIVLAYHLSEAASHLARHLSTVAMASQKQQLSAALTTDRRLRDQLLIKASSRSLAEMQRSNHACGRSFMSLLTGLEILWENGTEAAKREHGGVTYTFIHAIKTILSTVTSTCQLIAKQKCSAFAAPSAASKVPVSKSKVAKQMVQAQIPWELKAFICSVLSHLKPEKNGSHAALFEGILYYLLNRTGQCLFACTFGYERTESIATDIEAKPLNEIKQAALRIEMKCLAPILENAMALAPAMLGSLNPAGTKKPARSKALASKSIPAIKNALAITTKEKLQATLVYCIFGDKTKDPFEAADEKLTEADGDETDDEDAESRKFLEMLRKPVPIAPMQKLSVVEDSDVDEWFTEQVWKMVGWDVLSRPEF